MNHTNKLKVDFRRESPEARALNFEEMILLGLSKDDALRTRVPSQPQISGLGSAFPKTEYTQKQICSAFGIETPAVLKLMASGHIHTRRLYLPTMDSTTQVLKDETPAELHQKFRRGVLDIGVEAARRALLNADLGPGDMDVLIAVTSSGFAVPGVSSLIANELKMRRDLHRIDIVGMGCNAGMSALYTATSMARGSPHLKIMLVCCEINSASYVRDESIRTGIVNSLFGDGASALIIENSDKIARNLIGGDPAAVSTKARIRILDFETFTLEEQKDAMRFDWNEVQSKWSFFLSKDIPFVISKSMSVPVDHLLTRHRLTKTDIKHWVIHTGGGAVIDGAKRALSLSEFDVRHTRSVLRDYGNISSGSFMVSLERLIQEGSVRQGDRGVMIAMGPGSTIEAALVTWG